MVGGRPVSQVTVLKRTVRGETSKLLNLDLGQASLKLANTMYLELEFPNRRYDRGHVVCSNDSASASSAAS